MKTIWIFAEQKIDKISKMSVWMKVNYSLSFLLEKKAVTFLSRPAELKNLQKPVLQRTATKAVQMKISG